MDQACLPVLGLALAPVRGYLIVAVTHVREQTQSHHLMRGRGPTAMAGRPLDAKSLPPDPKRQRAVLDTYPSYHPFTASASMAGCLADHSCLDVMCLPAWTQLCDLLANQIAAGRPHDTRILSTPGDTRSRRSQHRMADTARDCREKVYGRREVVKLEIDLCLWSRDGLRPWLSALATTRCTLATFGSAGDAIASEEKKHKKEKKHAEEKPGKDKKEKKDKKDRPPTSTPTSIFGTAPKDVDAGLASLFSANAAPVNIAAARPTRAARPTAPVNRDALDIDLDDESSDEEIPSDVAGALAAREALRHDGKKKRKRATEPEIEDIYMDKLRDDEPSPRTQKKQKKEPSPSQDGDQPVDKKLAGDEPVSDDNDEDGSSGSDSDSDDGEPAERIQHETEGGLQQQELDKANRTVFIGNLPSSVITDKSHYKLLKTAFKPHGGISSIRFRSIAFSDQIPRKAAFITRALHVDQTSVNAYLVFKTAEAARSSLSLNGTVLLSHHIRVDSIAHPAKTDSRRCVFVGNLDFEAAEESLWQHFSPCGAVENVRIVRDAKTNVGKGFAYVQFVDEIAVEKALLLNDQLMPAAEKGKKRKLRVTRAKNVRRKPATAAPTTSNNTRGGGGRNGVYVPKPDPKKAGMAGRAGKLFGRAGGAKARKMEENGTFEGTRAVPGMETGLKSGGSGKRKGKPRVRKTARSAAWKTKKT
ncbi:hypothetical protein Dda_7515 [Drechslerella dactyloides]|uniref:Nucleolar protein 12 n=1 Tax=Drechslerella dactyloides TaxID=74499 RepID=A0AAD6IWL8_DREDA|nr:hypothetical protein Dda_7515 [Drechslerella dactyloides]